MKWLEKVFKLFGYHLPKPKPWEDLSRPAHDRAKWIESQPKSLHVPKKGKRAA